jgi:hypothetical protein
MPKEELPGQAENTFLKGEWNDEHQAICPIVLETGDTISHGQELYGI